VNPGTLMGFINDNVKGKVPVGRIDLMRNFSFFEVPEDLASKVVNTFKGMYVDERKLMVQIAQDDNGQERGKKKFYGNDSGRKSKKKKIRY
jgi:ATP-dependent RNA helicase DeaD